jgi:hypothetical protein
MSEKWINDSEIIVKQLKEMTETSNRDRLELVRSTNFALRSLARSLNGWIQYKNSFDRTGRFSLQELEEMNKTIIDFTASFIEYDIKITHDGIQKRLIQRRNDQRKASEGSFYT